MHKFTGSISYIGMTDPDPKPKQHYEIHCGLCNWWGYKKNLHLGLGCPICCSIDYLEYQDSLERLDSTVTVLLKQGDALLKALIQLDKDMVH